MGIGLLGLLRLLGLLGFLRHGGTAFLHVGVGEGGVNLGVAVFFLLFYLDVCKIMSISAAMISYGGMGGIS